MSVPEALLRAAQAGDQAACGQLVEENQGLIWSIVRRYARGHLELDDLYQLGCLGFLKAVQGFDLAFGTQFSTYAVPKIAGEIRRFLRDDSMVKIGRGRKERGYLIQKARASLSAELGREPVLSELSQATGLTPEEIAESDLRVALIGELTKARKEKGISQRELEELSGVKQPVIARMENGITTPNLSTVLKVLAPLGKTLYIGDLKQG